MNKRALLAGAIAAVVSTTVSAQVYDSDDAGADEPGHEPGEWPQPSIWDKPGFVTTGYKAASGEHFYTNLDRVGSVSLINVTTPKQGQPGFEESKEFLNSLIAGKSVRIVVPVGTPRTEFGTVLVHAWRIEPDGSRTYLNRPVREHIRSQPTPAPTPALTLTPAPESGDITHHYWHLIEQVCKSLGLEVPDVTILDYWNSLDAQAILHPNSIFAVTKDSAFIFSEARVSWSESLKHSPKKYIFLVTDRAKNPKHIFLWHELAHAMLYPVVECVSRLQETSDRAAYNACVHNSEFWQLEKKLYDVARML